MKLYRLHARQHLALSPEEAWDFFASPANLPLITPPWLDFQMTNDVPPRMYAGAIVTYRVRPVLGLPVQWITEITHVDEPRFFVDEQRFGPYRLWHHQHHFRPVEGGVEVEDLVHYALPLGLAGRLANRLTVHRRLEEIFSFRREALAERFGTLPGGDGGLVLGPAEKGAEAGGKTDAKRHG